MVRKRYTVAVVGLGGTSAAQRSEVSRHRRERDALAAASDERDRLTILYGAGARKYHIAVECDGEIIHRFQLEQEGLPDDAVMVRDAPPAELAEPALDAAPRAEHSGTTAEHPLASSAGDDGDARRESALDVDDPMGPVREDDAPAAADATGTDLASDEGDSTTAISTRAAHTTTDQEPDMLDTATRAFRADRDAGARPAMPTWDDVPSGPVPAEVLRYFESAVAREEARQASRHRDEVDV